MKQGIRLTRILDLGSGGTLSYYGTGNYDNVGSMLAGNAGCQFDFADFYHLKHIYGGIGGIGGSPGSLMNLFRGFRHTEDDPS